MRTKLILLTAAFLSRGVGIGVAQPTPGPASVPLPPAARDQAPADVTGTVQMFELTPAGELEGFILSDGTEVHLPPHLTQQLATAVRSEDRVEVRWRSATPGFVVGTSVTDNRSGQAVVDHGPPPPGTRPPPLPPGQPAPGAQWASVYGRVQQYLHGPAGDINGAALDDGTQLKLPPPAAYQISVWLQPGQTVAAEGYLLRNDFGQVMQVQAIGPSPERLAQVGWPAAPKHRPPPEPRPASGYVPPSPAPGGRPPQ